LLRDSEKRQELGRAARQLVEKKYSWNSVGQQLIGILNQVARGTSEQQSQAIEA
jgi:glycosyltransferase involved in cell wall biosynthesis